MHSIKLEVEDSVFDKVIYFLKNLPRNEVKVVEQTHGINSIKDDNSEISALTNHSVLNIQEWQDEDDIWK